MPTGIKVADVMRKSVVTVSPSDDVEKALKYMVALDIGCVVVSEKDRPVGVLTNSNVLERVVAKKLDPKKVRIKDVMSHPVRGVEPSASIEKAIELMRDNEVKRLPVVKNGKLLGLLSERDVMRVAPAIFEIEFEEGELSKPLPVESKEATAEFEGVCENCNEFKEDLKPVKGMLMCKECREEEEE
jgi:CBS domain-containing protein